MIASKIYSVATTLYLVSLLLSAVLVDSAKIKCTKSVSSKEFNINKEEFVVLLEHKTGSTSAASGSGNAAILKQHLDFFEDCLGMDSKPFYGKNNGKITTKKSSSNTVLHFSGGSIFGYVGFFNPRLVKQQIKTFPNVKIVEKVSKAKIFAAIQNNGHKTTESTSFYDLDRIDQRNNILDGKFHYPTPAGEDVNVYVVDTGINIASPEFGNRARHGGSFCAGCGNTDDHGHGTAVASVIGGIHFGVAKKVNLIAVKVFDGSGAGSSANIIAGLSFILADHLANNNKRTVVNMSLGGGHLEAVDSAVKALTDEGIHVIVAAGNDGDDACNISPASAPSAITACATQKSSDTIADFSNFGPCVDICAPGVDIPVLKFGLIPDQASGTSFSSPLVAGVVALKISAFGNLSPERMAQRLFFASTKNIIQGLPAGTPNRFLFVPQIKK
nr:9640_t:CDS:1 [Entrophospora candida]CAG8619922.1 13897_t:CDS:1 [Entrophospora candida]